MADKLTNERVQAVADYYCTNGYIKSKALESAGYSRNYSRNNGLKLFDKDRVKQAIQAKQAEVQAKTGYDYDQAMLALTVRLAYLEEQASNGNIQAIQAQTVILREKNEISGLHKQIIQQDETLRPAQFTPEEQARLKAQAVALTKPALKLSTVDERCTGTV